jgi:two-component system, OmpR family, manganese sensing sensor histidine kinase
MVNRRCNFTVVVKGDAVVLKKRADAHSVSISTPIFMFNRSRENLARWFTLSMGSILIVFAGVLYVLEAKEQRRAFDQRLYDICQFMAAGVEDGGYQDRRRIDLENVPVLGGDALTLNTTLIFARWYSPDRELVQFYGDIPPEQLPDAPGFETIVGQVQTSAEPVRLRQLTLPVYQSEVLIGYLQVATPLTPVEQALWQLRLFLMVGVPTALGAIALTGWFLGGLAMQPIRQSYQQLQQFTADASHELRSPLSAIINHAQVGLLDLHDPQEQQLRLEKITKGAESMAKLISDLLLLARNAGRIAPDVLRSVNVIDLLQPLAEDYREQIATSDLTLICEFPKQPLLVKAEPDLLRQAIANLLHNAIRYTPAGGVITLSAFRQANRAVIEVKDTGIGIAAADLSHVFERFYRVDKVRSRQTGGFGLGLAIVQQIVIAHGGQISVNSQPEAGSTFQIELPIASKSTSA